MSAIGFGFLAGVRFEGQAIFDNCRQGREIRNRGDLDAVACSSAGEISQLARIGGSYKDLAHCTFHHADCRRSNSHGARRRIIIKSSVTTEMEAPTVRSHVRVNSISTRLKPRSTETSIWPVPSRVPARTTRPLTTTRQAG